MKKEAFTHPKVDDLAEALDCEYLTAIGIVAALWSIPQRVESCLSGVIPWKPSRLARFMRWHGDADELVAALLATRLLDKISEDRTHALPYASGDPLGDAFAIHDWAHHAPGWVTREARKREGLWANGFVSDGESIPPSIPNALPNASAKEKGRGKGISSDTKTGERDTGVGGVGEGVVDPMSWVDAEWWAQTRRWPDHASLSERGLVANVGTCARRLKSEGLGTALEARLLRSLVLDWPRAGLDPWNALQRILDGLDDPTIKNRVAVLRRRISPYIEMATEVA